MMFLDKSPPCGRPRTTDQRRRDAEAAMFLSIFTSFAVLFLILLD